MISRLNFLINFQHRLTENRNTCNTFMLCILTFKQQHTMFTIGTSLHEVRTVLYDVLSLVRMSGNCNKLLPL